MNTELLLHSGAGPGPGDTLVENLGKASTHLEFYTTLGKDLRGAWLRKQ
jgi:hypothetical protein